MQVWYVVPPGAHQPFLSSLQQQMGLPAAQLSTAAAMCAVKTLLPLLPAQAVRALGVRRLVQKPGDIILTCPVRWLAPCLRGVVVFVFVLLLLMFVVCDFVYAY